MSNHWPRVPLEEVAAPEANALAGGPFGSDLVSADYREEGVPVIRGANCTGEGRYVHGPFVYVSEDKARTLARNLAHPGDVVFTQRGTVGQVALIPEDLGHDTFVISQSQMKLTCARDQILPEFVYYWFRSPEVLDYLDRHTIATGVPHTNLGILRRTPILRPPLAIQRIIVRHLLHLDERIASLRELRGALGRLHAALFAAWFVDFEPVGRTDHPTLRGLPRGLFPIALVPSTIGPIPAGWETAGLLECAEFRNGAAFRTEDFSAPGVGLPIIKIAELHRGVGPQTRWSATGGRRERRLADGDVLFAWSGNPQSSIGITLWGGGSAWLNQHIYQVLADEPEDRSFLYGLLCHLQPTFVEIARNRQTTGLGHVAKKDLRRLEVIRPPIAIREAFAELTAPLLDSMVAAQSEAITLVKVRDALLPHLLRGDLPELLTPEPAPIPQATREAAPSPAPAPEGR